MRLHGRWHDLGSHGFSLLEMLAVLGFAAVIGLIAAPQFAGLVGEYRLTSAANQVAFELSRARMQAIGQNSYVRLRFLDGNTYVRESSTDGVHYTTDDSPVNLPNGVKALSDGGVTSFNKSGMALVVAPIRLSVGRESKTVRTNSLGRVTVS